MLWIALLEGASLPPPVCRGKVFGNFDPHQNKPGAPRAVAEVQAAYDALCPTQQCGTGQIFENPTIGNNAVTWVSGIRDGTQTRAMIVYSAPFLDGLSRQFGPGASFGVLAHEVGHHLTAALALRPGTKLDSSWDEELRADYFAGCALGRSGRPPDELENALRALAQVATTSHPAFELRTQVVRKGYGDCRPRSAATAQKSSFGIGAALRAAGRTGCWGFWARSPDEVSRIGPVAAKRKRSKVYEDATLCEQARKRISQAELENSERCSCE
jgi:hypothetical protein